MILLPLVFFTALILLANWLVTQEKESYTFYFDWMLILMHIPLLFVALVIASIPADAFSRYFVTGVSPLNPAAFGLTLAGISLWGIIMAVRPVRRLLALRLPLDPYSPVHALALVMSGYLIASTVFALTQGGLEELAATAAPASTGDILFQFFAFVALALLGVGLFTRRGTAATITRLGLERPTSRQLLLGIRWIALLVVLQWVVGAIGALLDPDQLELLDNISASLLNEIDTIWEWLLLALATGIGEELLFRGALQPRLGLKTTAALFAVAHVQYGITPITLAVLIIGVALGYIRKNMNTTMAIFVHVGYNFVLGLLTLAAALLPSAAG